LICGSAAPGRRHAQITTAVIHTLEEGRQYARRPDSIGSLEAAELRQNSQFKVDALLGALHRFRDGLAAEAELAARRH
jgi:hypothetical protein